MGRSQNIPDEASQGISRAHNADPAPCRRICRQRQPGAPIEGPGVRTVEPRAAGKARPRMASTTPPGSGLARKDACPGAALTPKKAGFATALPALRSFSTQPRDPGVRAAGAGAAARRGGNHGTGRWAPARRVNPPCASAPQDPAYGKDGHARCPAPGTPGVRAQRPCPAARSSSRAMISCWIWLVPSKSANSRASRYRRSTG